jgi:hypothetical protein
MKNLLFTLLLVAALFVAVSVSPVQAGPSKVLVCHVPDGNPENVQLLEVGAPAAESHFAEHAGDYPGSPVHGCQVAP